MLAEDFFSDLRRKAVVAVGEKIFHGRQHQKPLLHIGLEPIGEFLSGEPVGEIAIEPVVSGRKKEIPHEGAIARVVNGVEAAHIRDAEGRRPIRIEHILATEYARMILVLRLQKRNVGSARIGRCRHRREFIQKVEARHDEVESELQPEQNDQASQHENTGQRGNSTGYPCGERHDRDRERTPGK